MPDDEDKEIEHGKVCDDMWALDLTKLTVGVNKVWGLNVWNCVEECYSIIDRTSITLCCAMPAGAVGTCEEGGHGARPPLILCHDDAQEPGPAVWRRERQ